MATEGAPVMAKQEVLASFEMARRIPGVEKSGNVLADELNKRAARYVKADRAGLVDAVGEWLESYDEVLAVQAAILVREFQLNELRDATQRIRDEVALGRFMKPRSVWIFDRALESLS